MTRKKKITIAVIVVVVVLALNVALCLISAYNFYTLNYFRSFPGYLLVKWNIVEMVEIRGGENKIMLVSVPYDKPAPSLIEYMEAQGYTHLEEEQMGYMHWFEKDGERQAVMQWPGGYGFSRLDCTIWTWE